MRIKQKRKQSQSQRLAVKTVLVAGAAACIVLIGIGSVVWQTFRDEPSQAGLPMVISKVGLIRTDHILYNGSQQQPVLGVKIETRGDGNQPLLKRIIFSLSGTSSPSSALLSNARLFVTSDGVYSPGRQIGKTISTLTGNQLSIELDHKLESGDNYVWLTFDINNKTGKSDALVYADCHLLKIENLDYEPSPSSDSRGIKIQPCKPWYSTATGELASLSSWNSERDGSGSVPKSFKDDAQVFYIQAGSVMLNTLNACLPNLVIENKGTLQSNSALSALNVTIESGGIWNQSGVFTDPAKLKSLYVKNGGNYLQLNHGPFPGLKKSFEPASTVWMSNFTSVDSLQILWGNVVADCGNATIEVPSKVLSNVKGSFELHSGSLVLHGTDTVNIAGDLIISGGRLTVASSSGSPTIKTGRNLILKGGTLTDQRISGNSRSDVSVYVANDVTVSGGDISFGSNSTIYPACNTMRTGHWRQERPVTASGNIVLQTSCSLIIQGITFGPVSENAVFSIMSNAKIDLGNALITGNGSFLLNDNSTIAIGHADGLYSESAKGNIRTATRTYSALANYIYNSQTPVQHTGTFQTTTQPELVKNLRLLKPRAGDTLLLERNFEIKESFSTITGNVNYNGFRIDVVSDKTTAQAGTGANSAR
ncbi:MAG TPA: hypothetical protein VFW78_13395 [Bacteroidia bacterium]|nr:hypothetical protein [Bacteroidia bacterium]